jgi:hypothetical protein
MKMIAQATFLTKHDSKTLEEVSARFNSQSAPVPLALCGAIWIAILALAVACVDTRRIQLDTQ